MPDRKTQCLLNAQWRKDQTLAKVNEGLKQVIESGKPFDLKTVAEVSGVSVTWFHRHPSVKKRILELQIQKLTSGGFSPEAFSQLLKRYTNLESRFHKLERDYKKLQKMIEPT